MKNNKEFGNGLKLILTATTSFILGVGVAGLIQDWGEANDARETLKSMNERKKNNDKYFKFKLDNGREITLDRKTQKRVDLNVTRSEDENYIYTTDNVSGFKVITPKSDYERKYEKVNDNDEPLDMNEYLTNKGIIEWKK